MNIIPQSPVIIVVKSGRSIWNANLQNIPINMHMFHTIFNSLRPSDAYSVSKLTIIGSDNGLSPGRRQAITWTYDGILLNKLQWNPKRNSFIFIQENAFENVYFVSVSMS